jgi:hypothetical protein
MKKNMGKKDSNDGNQYVLFTGVIIVLGVLLQNFFLLETDRDLTNLARNLPAWKKTAFAPFDSNYLEILEEFCGWTIVDDIKNATLIWSRAGPQDFKVQSLRLGHGQIYSLVENTDVMTDKAHLHDLLFEANGTFLQPETYMMGNQKECAAFFRRAEREPDIVWVSKEPSNSQGDGIVVNPDIKKLREEWLSDPYASSDTLSCIYRSESHHIVIQRYIRDPLLLEGK